MNLGLVFALGCSTGAPVSTDITVDAKSCVEGALSMTFSVQSTQLMILPVYISGTPNVLGYPTILSGTNEFHVFADLDTLGVGEAVSMQFNAAASMPNAIGAQNIQFYTVPVAQLPHDPACPPEDDGPVIAVENLPGLGWHLEVSNPSSAPIVLEKLEVAAVSTPLSRPLQHWDSPVLESVGWQVVRPPGTVLLPGTPAEFFDLPDTPPPGTQATLCRYIATSGGQEHRAIVQAYFFGGPVATESRSWGGVKTLFRANQ
jgi:hypothetical protein